MPTLQISLPDGTTASHELNDDRLSLGRLSDNAIQIDDASVSSHHAELVREGSEYVLRDLDSTNGTFVNGQSHTEGRLQDGDQVRFGNIDAVYASDNSAAVQPMPEEAAVELQPAEQSIKPADFANASPFQTKKKQKDPIAATIIGLAVLAIIAFAAAVASVFTLKAPM